MKKITTLLALFLVFLGIGAQEKSNMVIGEIHEKISSLDQLQDGGYFIFKNIGRGKYVYEGEENLMCMGAEVKYGESAEFVWQAKKNTNGTYSFVSLNGNYVPVLKAGGQHFTVSEVEKGNFKLGLNDKHNLRWWIQNESNNICWNGDADTFCGWSAKGGNSDYEIYPVVVYDRSTLVEITYEYYIDGVKVHTQTALQAKGSQYAAPTLNNDFITYSVEEGTVGEEPATIKVVCTENLPFEKSLSFEEAKWNFITITASKLFFSYVEGASEMLLKEKLPENMPDDKNLFCFVGDVINGFTIYNKLAGKDMILSAPVDMTADAGGKANVIMRKTPVSDEFNSKWNFATSPHLDGGFLLYQQNLADNKVNKRGDKLAFWYGNSDAGSTVFFTPEQNLVSGFVADLLKDYQKYEGYIGAYDASILPEMEKVTDMASLKQYLEFLKTAKTNVIEEGKLYRIRNYARNLAWGNGVNEGYGGYMGTTHYADLPNWADQGGSSSVSCATDQLDDAGTVWTFEKEGEGYYLKNANNGEYLTATAQDHDIYLETTADKSAAGLYKIEAFSNYRFALTCITEGVNTAWNQLHASGRGVMNCNGNERSASAWYIIAANNFTANLKPVEGVEGNWSTLYLPFGLKLTEGVTAYAGKVVGDELKLTAIEKEVPANTGVILKGVESAYTMQIADVTTQVKDNDLKGSNVKVVLFNEETAEDDSYDYLTLGFGDMGFGMYNPVATELPQNTAFVGPVSGGASTLKIVFGESTGVESVETEVLGKKVYYDLSGRRVVLPIRGLYIVNGKKVYVK